MVCAISFTIVKQGYFKLSEHFLSYLVSDEYRYTEPTAVFDLYVEENLNASEVLDVIEYSDSRFEDLTRQSSWPTHL